MEYLLLRKEPLLEKRQNEGNKEIHPVFKKELQEDLL